MATPTVVQSNEVTLVSNEMMEKVYETLERVYGLTPVQARAIMSVNDFHDEMSLEQKDRIIASLLKDERFAASYILMDGQFFPFGKFCPSADV